MLGEVDENESKPMTPVLHHCKSQLHFFFFFSSRHRFCNQKCQLGILSANQSKSFFGALFVNAIAPAFLTLSLSSCCCVRWTCFVLFLSFFLSVGISFGCLRVCR